MILTKEKYNSIVFSDHALDQAEERCLKAWKKQRDQGQGFYDWLKCQFIASLETITQRDTDGRDVFYCSNHNRLRFIFCIQCKRIVVVTTIYRSYKRKRIRSGARKQRPTFRYTQKV